LDVTYRGKRITEGSQEYAGLKEYLGSDSPFMQFLTDRIYNHKATWGLEVMLSEGGLKAIQKWYDNRQPRLSIGPSTGQHLTESEAEEQQARDDYLDQNASEATLSQYPYRYPLARDTAFAQGSALMGTAPGQVLVVLDAIGTLNTETDKEKRTLAIAQLALVGLSRIVPSLGAPEVHGNDLRAAGPHDVYVIRDATTGRIYHFGETGRGFETRGAEWVRMLREEYGLDTVVEHLKTVDGKASARALEVQYIDTYEKVFGFRPGYDDATGRFILIQKGRH
jgi:hypothetical protein